jgi:Predicted transcriptional regulators
MNNLKLLRKRKGMLQDDVAKYLGLTRPAYSHYETGKRVPDGEMLEKLADLYEVTIDELMGRIPVEDVGRHLEEVPELIPEDEVMIPLVASLRCGPGHSGEPFTYIKPIPIPSSYIRRWGEGL